MTADWFLGPFPHSKPPKWFAVRFTFCSCHHLLFIPVRFLVVWRSMPASHPLREGPGPIHQCGGWAPRAPNPGVPGRVLLPGAAELGPQLHPPRCPLHRWFNNCSGTVGHRLGHQSHSCVMCIAGKHNGNLWVCFKATGGFQDLELHAKSTDFLANKCPNEVYFGGVSVR